MLMTKPPNPVTMHPKLNRNALIASSEIPMSERLLTPKVHLPSIVAERIHMTAKKTGITNAKYSNTFSSGIFMRLAYVTGLKRFSIPDQYSIIPPIPLSVG